MDNRKVEPAAACRVSQRAVPKPVKTVQSVVKKFYKKTLDVFITILYTSFEAGTAPAMRQPVSERSLSSSLTGERKTSLQKILNGSTPLRTQTP